MGTIVSPSPVINGFTNGFDHSSDNGSVTPSNSHHTVHFSHAPLQHESPTSLHPSDDKIDRRTNNVSTTRSSSPLRSTQSSSSEIRHSKRLDTSPKQTHQALHAGTDYFTRRDSQDRRIRSENSPFVRTERTGSLLGKRPSVVTGGYETSSSSSQSSDHDTRKSQPGPSSTRSRISMPNSQSFFLPQNGTKHSGMRSRSHEGRRRSKSLMVPNLEEHAPRTALPQHLYTRPRSNSRNDNRRISHDRPRSAEMRRPSSRFSKNDMGQIAESSSSQSRQEAQEVVKSSPGRKGKGKMTNGLASSLGLDSGKGGVTLTTDQINELLSDTDVSTALRMMQGHLGPRLPLHTTPSSVSVSPSLSRSVSPQSHELFVPQAPPALLEENRERNRQREVSVSSTVEERKTRATSIGSVHPQGASPAALRLRRERAGSKIESEGGHIPYTHHLPAPSDNLDTRSISTVDTAAHGQNEGSTTTAEIKSQALRKEALGGKNRLSQLFHLKGKSSSEKLRGKSARSAQSDKDERVKAQRDRERAPEREKGDRDVQIRRAEQERREAELAQERRYRALTQVSAHPDSERAAYRTSSHLRAYYNLVYEGIETIPPINPLAVLRWKHRTQEQLEAKQKWEKEKTSAAIDQFGAIDTSLNRHSEQPASSAAPQGKGTVAYWSFNVADIEAYKAAGGVVNYFIPPRQPLDPVFADSRTDVRSPSPRVPEERSSIADSAPYISSSGPRMASVSAVSLAAPSSTLSHEPISRTTSNDLGRRHREHKLTHRTHHSLGAIGSQGISQAIKAPFEKLGSAARAKRSETLPPLQTDDENIKRQSTRKRPTSATGRRDWHITMDEDRSREFHLRKLFLKGQRGEIKRLEVDKMSAGGAKEHDRAAELLALQNALTKEAAFRDRQVKAERQTALEAEARERMRQLEEEIYADRAKQLIKAKQSLERVNVNLEDTSDRVRHYLAQIDQLTSVAQIAAGVQLQFPNLAIIRRANAKRAETRNNIDESTDVLSPLRSPTAYESGTDSASRRPSRQASLVKRKASTPPLPPLLSLGIKPWPRRTSLDPDGTTRVDLITRTELAVDVGRKHHLTLLGRRDEALRELETMIHSLDSLVKQKDAVRSWTKSALDTSRILRNQRDALQAEIEGNTSARLARMTDTILDRGLRVSIWPFLGFILDAVGFSRWVASRRNETTRREYTRSGGKFGWRCCWLLLFIVGAAMTATVLYWWGD